MVRQKLKSRRGASVVIALLVLLVCVTAGTAALTAAGANAGRYTHIRADQQRYLAVASAARVVREELCGGRLTVRVEAAMARDPVTLELTVETDQETGAVNGSYTYACTGSAFGPWLTGGGGSLSVAGLLDTDDLPISPVSCTDLGFDVAGEDAGMLENVHWSLEMDQTCQLVARFWLEEDGERYYPMVLTVPAQGTEGWDETMERDTSVARERWIVTRSAEITWPEAGAVITQS